jgi:hypothetical protein
VQYEDGVEGKNGGRRLTGCKGTEEEEEKKEEWIDHSPAISLMILI